MRPYCHIQSATLEYVSKFFWHPRVSKRVKKQKLGSSPIGVEIRVKTCQKVSKRVKTIFFDTIFWHLRSGARGMQIRVKTCQKSPSVKKCLHAPACQKIKPSFSLDVSCQNVSKRVKNIFFDTPGASKCLPKPCRFYPIRSKSVKACQNVSKNIENVRKHNVF